MNKTITQQIQFTAEFFFFLIGILYSIGYLLNSNRIFSIEYEYFLAFADLPFLFSATIYFFLSLVLKSQNKHFLKYQNSKPENTPKKDFFWQYFLAIFSGSVIFFSYLVIDILA